jgi:hypothetical protein
LRFVLSNCRNKKIEFAINSKVSKKNFSRCSRAALVVVVRWVLAALVHEHEIIVMSPSTPSDEAVVQTAADAAEGVIFAEYRQSTVTDVDITVSFESGVLEVDVYLNIPDDVSPPADDVADEAARTAQAAVDELFDETQG